MDVGNVEKLSQLREICSWFPDLAMLYEEAVGIANCLTDDEKAHMRPNRSLPMEYLYWAMMEAKTNPMQSYRWRAYKSSRADAASHPLSRVRVMRLARVRARVARTMASVVMVMRLWTCCPVPR